MRLEAQFLVYSGIYFIAMLFFRSLLAGVIYYQMNISAIKKRKKGQTFKEWILYSRFREEIPKILLILYFFVLTIYPLIFIISIIASLITSADDVAIFLLASLWIFNFLLILPLGIMFKGDNYDRWIKKRRGMKKRKRRK